MGIIGMIGGGISETVRNILAIFCLCLPYCTLFSTTFSAMPGMTTLNSQSLLPSLILSSTTPIIRISSNMRSTSSRALPLLAAMSSAEISTRMSMLSKMSICSSLNSSVMSTYSGCSSVNTVPLPSMCSRTVTSF